ncbi:MAG TPA: hypothetical protein VF742_13245 [Terracidiphilus sp.]|jgi:hypothetical protein
MALTVEAIETAENNDALFDLLSAELQRLLPKEVRDDLDLYHEKLASMPRGLRAMAGMHFFDVSMSMDDLAWHFGNQNDERDLQETLNGLRELELTEIAAYFEKMWDYMKPHMMALQTGDIGGKDFHDWLEEIGAQQVADPMDDIIWAYCEKAGKYGLLESWAPYARKYPERCIVAEAQA